MPLSVLPAQVSHSRGLEILFFFSVQISFYLFMVFSQGTECPWEKDEHVCGKIIAKGKKRK